LKDKIIEVLKSFGDQANLASNSARNNIAEAIVVKLNEPSRAQRRVNFDNDREQWVCEYCNENTWEVYNDYMGSGTNHLQCELEEEMKGKKNE